MHAHLSVTDSTKITHINKRNHENRLVSMTTLQSLLRCLSAIFLHRRAKTYQLARYTPLFATSSFCMVSVSRGSGVSDLNVAQDRRPGGSLYPYWGLSPIGASDRCRLAAWRNWLARVWRRSILSHSRDKLGVIQQSLLKIPGNKNKAWQCT